MQQLKELSDADADKQGELKGQAIEESWQSCVGCGESSGECNAMSSAPMIGLVA